MQIVHQIKKESVFLKEKKKEVSNDALSSLEVPTDPQPDEFMDFVIPGVIEPKEETPVEIKSSSDRQLGGERKRRKKTHIRGRPLHSCKHCDFVGANERERRNHLRNMDTSLIEHNLSNLCYYHP